MSKMLQRSTLVLSARRFRLLASTCTQTAFFHTTHDKETRFGRVAGEPSKVVLYETHTPTSPTQKILLSLVSAISVFTNPERADMLATLGEVTGRNALQRLHARMCSDRVGIRILIEKPSIRSTHIDINYLRSLPSHTFGYAYSQFMDAHGYVQCVSDSDTYTNVTLVSRQMVVPM